MLPPRYLNCVFYNRHLGADIRRSRHQSRQHEDEEKQRLADQANTPTTGNTERISPETRKNVNYCRGGRI